MSRSQYAQCQPVEKGIADSGGRVGRVFGVRGDAAPPGEAITLTLPFAKTQRRFDCLDDSYAVFLTDRDAILDHLYARTEAFNFWIDIHTHHLVVDPNTQVTLLLEKIEKCTRRGFWRDGNPKRDENILSRAVLQYLVSNRLRGLGADFATTIRAERFRDMRPEQFHIVVDLCHGADGRTRALGRLVRWRSPGNAANVVHARFVHAVEELPHVRTERFDVATLAFGVYRLERQARFATAARAGDDCQFSERQIEIDTFKVILARSTNFDAIRPRWRGKALFFPDLRTHWKYSLPVKRFANYGGSAGAPPAVSRASRDTRSKRVFGMESMRAASPTGRRVQSRAFFEAGGQLFALFLQFFWNYAAQGIEKLFVRSDLFLPLLVINSENFGDALMVYIEFGEDRSGPLGNQPMGDLSALPVPSQRSTIHLSTRMFSPKPGQRNLPSLLFAKPVHVKDVWRIGLSSHHQPVAEVVAHVIAGEG